MQTLVLAEFKPIEGPVTYDNTKGISLITAANRRNPPQCVDSFQQNRKRERERELATLIQSKEPFSSLLLFSFLALSFSSSRFLWLLSDVIRRVLHLKKLFTLSSSAPQYLIPFQSIGNHTCSSPTHSHSLPLSLSPSFSLSLFLFLCSIRREPGVFDVIDCFC